MSDKSHMNQPSVLNLSKQSQFWRTCMSALQVSQENLKWMIHLSRDEASWVFWPFCNPYGIIMQVRFLSDTLVIHQSKAYLLHPADVLKALAN